MPARVAPDLTGVRVLVTGAASGIGLAVLRRCHAEGASVAGLDVEGERLEQATADLRVQGDRPIVIAVADVSEPEQVARAVDTVGRTLGGLNALANIAGIGGYTGDVVSTSLSDWNRTLAVNLTGMFLLSKEVLPLLRAEGEGSIVNVSSQYGLVGGAGSPAYVSSKAGVIGLTRAMAVDHAPDNVRVNCVCPGPVDTPMFRADHGDAVHALREERRTQHRRLLPGIGSPEGIAAAIAFLLGPDAVEITGAVISLDGGWTVA